MGSFHSLTLGLSTPATKPLLPLPNLSDPVSKYGGAIIGFLDPFPGVRYPARELRQSASSGGLSCSSRFLFFGAES